jgi:hypothetical protein
LSAENLRLKPQQGKSMHPAKACETHHHKDGPGTMYIKHNISPHHENAKACIYMLKKNFKAEFYVHIG